MQYSVSFKIDFVMTQQPRWKYRGPEARMPGSETYSLKLGWHSVEVFLSESGKWCNLQVIHTTPYGHKPVYQLDYDSKRNPRMLDSGNFDPLLRHGSAIRQAAGLPKYTECLLTAILDYIEAEE